MKKIFKTKKRYRKKLLIVFIFVLSLTISFYIILNKIYLHIISTDNSLIVKKILNPNLNSINPNALKNIKNPSFIIKYMLNLEPEIKDPVPVIQTINNSPIIYLYNSHPKEEYSNSSLEVFSVTPTVVTFDYMLKEYLENKNTYVLVESNSTTDILKQNNWKYGYSYKASRIMLENAIKKNESLEYFIDIHRDSAPKSVTTTTIDNKNYAKVMFVIGLEYDTYKNNLKLAEKINDTLNKEYPSLSRGIIKKSGPGVNGVYNQDFNANTILIEIGGVDNTIEELNNTAYALSDVISKIVNIKYE